VDALADVKTEKLYQEVISKVKECLQELRSTFKSRVETIATYLAKLDFDALSRAKKDLRFLADPKWVERLWLFGRGKLSWHWAKDEHAKLPLDVLRKRPIQQLLNDVDREVTVYLPRHNPPMVRKALASLSGYELAQVLDLEKAQFRSEKAQMDWLRSREAVPDRPEKDPEDALEMDSLKLSKDGRFYYVIGRLPEDDPGTRRAVIKVSAKVLRSTLK